MTKKEEPTQSMSISNKTNNNLNIKDLSKNENHRLEQNSNAKQVIDLQYKEYDTLTQFKTEQMSDKDSIKHGKNFDINLIFFGSITL